MKFFFKFSIARVKIEGKIYKTQCLLYPSKINFIGSSAIGTFAQYNISKTTHKGYDWNKRTIRFIFAPAPNTDGKMKE